MALASSQWSPRLALRNNMYRPTCQMVARCSPLRPLPAVRTFYGPDGTRRILAMSRFHRMSMWSVGLLKNIVVARSLTRWHCSFSATGKSFNDLMTKAYFWLGASNGTIQPWDTRHKRLTSLRVPVIRYAVLPAESDCNSLGATYLMTGNDMPFPGMCHIGYGPSEMPGMGTVLTPIQTWRSDFSWQPARYIALGERTASRSRVPKRPCNSDDQHRGAVVYCRG